MELNITNYIAAALIFVYFYPLCMAYVWMIGALQYYAKWESGGYGGFNNPPELPSYPPVSLIVPCHNEMDVIAETVQMLDRQKYPHFEIIAVNDGSTDQTAELLEQLSNRYAKLRVVHLNDNQGKAMALRMGALASPNEFLICIDGDTLLDAHATTWMMKHFLSGPRVGAVTGNPRVRTRSTLLGKIQVGEFSAMVGLIKRAQRIFGPIFTISGVLAGFRKSALQEVDYWSTDAITEDIDITWKLQLRNWDVRFESNAVCWILMPETFRGLWRQRLRWAQGGMEVFCKNLPRVWRWRHHRMWLLMMEYFISVIWAYTVLALILAWLAVQLLPQLQGIEVPPMLPGAPGVALGLTCLLQFAVGLFLDSQYEKGIGKYYYWMIWYPLAFWLFNVLTAVVGVPKALFRRRNRRATWVSPDRGIRKS
ncbi:MAG: poly-beta-1,6 N-acetyl-D-glucosamine synthase [Candidatus Polarisedimenticolaceae bacterium]|nr:poly-beta-1,6 N-acetyl-D-glucosamine synthase [Candidatus Polarisedimenticolaceae bacterium]